MSTEKKRDDDWRPVLTAITDVLVEGAIPYYTTAREPAELFVRVGRPIAHDADFYCPLEIPGWFSGVRPVFGVGPVDSLMNAMSLVKAYFAHVRGASKEPLPRLDEGGNSGPLAPAT